MVLLYYNNIMIIISNNKNNNNNNYYFITYNDTYTYKCIMVHIARRVLPLPNARPGEWEQNTICG